MYILVQLLQVHDILQNNFSTPLPFSPEFENVQSDSPRVSHMHHKCQLRACSLALRTPVQLVSHLQPGILK